MAFREYNSKLLTVVDVRFLKFGWRQMYPGTKKSHIVKKFTIEILEWFQSLLLDREMNLQQERQEVIFFVLHNIFLCFVGDINVVLGENRPENHEQNRLPSRYRRQFFEILSSYEFVSKEHSEKAIGPEILGIIFENVLGFSEKKQKNIRHNTGSFYTPPQIVNYMIEESLVFYLERTLSLKHTDETKEKLYQLLRCQTKRNPFDDDLNLTKEIVHSLSTCTIWDPCCGAGAFPMGVLDKMVEILEILDPQNILWEEIYAQKYCGDIETIKTIFDQNRVSTRFAKKFLLIKNCIFGVDIQPLATQICSWRCLISLISEIKKHAEIQPQQYLGYLQSIGTKFVSANALVDCPYQNQTKAFDLRLQTQQALQRIFWGSLEHPEHTDAFLEDYRQLMAQNCESVWVWNPFKEYQRSHPADCFDPLLMFGVDMFDIVITNPPYIGQKNNNRIFKPIKNSKLGKFHQRRMDYFYFFFHRAIDLVCPKGVISFITTNYYITATYADKLRKDIKERTSIRHMLNFDRLKIFAAAAGQHNLITILSKDVSDVPIKITHTQRQGMASKKVLREILYGMDVETLYFERIQNIYETENNYIFLQPKGKDNHISNILEMMQVRGTRLKDICDITQGIVTGADKLTDSHIKKYDLEGKKGDGIFILTNEEMVKFNILDSDIQSKPWFKNSDISRWAVHIEAKNFLLYIRMSDQHSISIRLRKHFERYKTILINRNTRSGTDVITNENYEKFLQGDYHIDYVMLASAQRKGRYYCISYARNPRFFESNIPKIVVPQRNSKNTFGYTEACFYASADVYFLISKKDIEMELKYILALLNSKLYYVWLYMKGKRKGENLELYQRPLEDIPIFANVDKETQQSFVDIVDVIHQRRNNNEDCCDLEEVVNKMVYELYGLTDEQITAIEGFGNS